MHSETNDILKNAKESDQFADFEFQSRESKKHILRNIKQSLTYKGYDWLKKSDVKVGSSNYVYYF